MPNLRMGGTDKVVLQLRDDDGNIVEAAENVTFNSSDSAVIQVSQVDTNAAMVTAVGVGTATVNATAVNPSGFVLNVAGRSYTVEDAPPVPAEGEPVSGEIVAEKDAQGAGTAPSPTGTKEPLAGDQATGVVNEPASPYGTVDQPVMGTAGTVEPYNPSPVSEPSPVTPQTGTAPDGGVL